jgi:hypothetical protein
LAGLSAPGFGEDGSLFEPEPEPEPESDVEPESDLVSEEDDSLPLEDDFSELDRLSCARVSVL